MTHYECPFKVGDMVIPVKPSNRLEGPNWASGMDNMEGNTYCIYSIAQSQNGYYLIRIGVDVACRLDITCGRIYVILRLSRA